MSWGVVNALKWEMSENDETFWNSGVWREDGWMDQMSENGLWENGMSVKGGSEKLH